MSAGWGRETGILKMLSVPILTGDELLGVLSVRSSTDELATDEHRALAISLAGRAALALQNARAYDDAVRRAARLRDLVAVSRSITASLDAGDVMTRIAQAAGSMRPGALAAVHVFDEDRTRLRAAALSGPEWEDLPLERPAGAGLPGLVVERHEPVLVLDPRHHPRTLAPTWWERRPRATYYGVPIDVGETFVGVLDYVLPEGAPDAEEQEALRLLAAQAGVAIRNARLYQGERVQAERVRAMVTVNQRISSALELDDLLRTISESASQLGGVRFGSFWLADDVSRTLMFTGGSDADMAGDFPRRLMSYDDGGVGWVARTRQRLIVQDVFADPRIVNLEWWQRWGMRTLIAYPVLAGDQLVAVLGMAHTEPVHLTDDTAEVIEMFVAQASVAIQNARLYREAQRRRDVAEVLADVARELAGTLEVERIAAHVARGVVDLLHVQGAAVCRHDEDGSLHEIATSGPAAPLARGMVLQPGEGVAGRAVAVRKIVTTTDILAEPEVVLPTTMRQKMVATRPAGRGRDPAARPRARDRRAGPDRPHRVASSPPTSCRRCRLSPTRPPSRSRTRGLYATAQDSLTRLRDTQAQLVQAAKMSALGQLVSGVAHELNNPLSVIIGYGQLLLDPRGAAAHAPPGRADGGPGRPHGEDRPELALLRPPASPRARPPSACRRSSSRRWPCASTS